MFLTECLGSGQAQSRPVPESSGHQREHGGRQRRAAAPSYTNSRLHKDPILFGTRFAKKALCPFPLAGEGGDGGKTLGLPVPWQHTPTQVLPRRGEWHSALPQRSCRTVLPKTFLGMR